MKYLYVLFALCFSVTAQCEVLVDQVTFESDWPLDFMLIPGEYYCPGGTFYYDGMGFPACDGGKGLHIRGTEIYSCLKNSVPFDPRIEGTVWIQVNDNLDQDYTGPAHGVWKAVPGDSCNKAFLINPDVYWEGSWEGKRELVSYDPLIWVHTVKVVGQGFGGELEGLQFRGIEEITNYTPMAIPNELLGVNAPESVVHAEIKSKIKK